MDGPEDAVFFAWGALVELARAVAEGVALRVSVIGDPAHPLWEAVCVLCGSSALVWVSFFVG